MKKYSPYLIIFISFFFIWYIIFQINDNFFYSGDGGVKFGYVKQIADGSINTSVENTLPLWVNKLYNKDYSPFNPPFFYNVNDEMHFSFPIYFPFMSSLMYKIGGRYGLYIIPSISLLFSWLIMLLYIKNNYNYKYGIIILIAYILATPLFLYGAIFWEHTLAVLLVSIGVFCFKSDNQNTFLISILSGFLFSLSIFFRPEAFVLVVLINIAFLIYYKIQKYSVGFVLSSFFSVFLFIIINYTIYNTIFGIHGKQVIEEVTHFSYLQKLIGLNYLFFRFNPFVFLGLILILLRILFDNMLSFNKDIVLLVILCMYCLIAPILLPNMGGKQWGARYLLILLPVFFMSSKSIVDVLRFSWLLKTVFILAISYSIYLNAIIGSKYLIKDYNNRVITGLKFLKNCNIKVIAVENDYILQEFYDLYSSKYFFLLKDNNKELFKNIKSNGYDKVILITTDQISSINSQVIYDKKLGDYHFRIINISN
jgi:hypothetical protein